MYTETSLLNATNQYHKFDTSGHMMCNKAFALTALSNLKQDLRNARYDTNNTLGLDTTHQQVN